MEETCKQTALIDVLFSTPVKRKSSQDVHANATNRLCSYADPQTVCRESVHVSGSEVSSGTIYNWAAAAQTPTVRSWSTLCR